MRTLSLSSILLLAVLATSSFGATYWVSPSGSDGNGCTNSGNALSGGARQTVRAGINCLGAGDTLYLRGGNYDPPGVFTAPAASSGQPVMIIGCGQPGGPCSSDSRPVVMGFSGVTDDMFYIGGFNSPDAYLTITHIDINGINTHGGSCIAVSQPHVTLDDVTCIDSGANAFATVGNGTLNNPGAQNSDYFVMRNSHVFGCGRITDTAPTDTKGAGLYTGHSHGIVENNEIADCMGIGFNIAYDSSNDSIYRNNIIHNLGCASKYGCSQSVSGTGPRAIGIGGSGVNGPNGPSNNLVYNNIIYSVRGSGGGSTSGECVQFWGSGRAGANQVYNTTCYDAGTHVATHCDGDNPVVVENNLFIGIDDSNLVGGDPSCGTLSGTGTSGGVMDESLNMVNANPATTVVNAPGHDFHLKSGSPAIQRGVNVSNLFTTDFDGNPRASSGAWDMGAYAFGSSVPVVTNVRFTQQPVSTPVNQTLPAVVVEGQDSSGNAVPSFTGPVTVQLTQGGTSIPANQLSLVSCDSFEPSPNACNGGSCACQKAFDGNTQTWWFSQVNTPPIAPLPHQMIINFGNTYTVTGLQYLPFPLGSSGNVKNYELYLSTTTTFPPTPVVSGTFANDLTQKTVNFSGQTAHYALFKMLSNQQGEAWSSIAELTFLQAGAFLGGTTTRAAVNGDATFDDLFVDTPGTYTLTASATGVPGTATSASFTITGGAGTQLIFVKQPQNTIAGLPLAAVQVAVEDNAGNIVTGSTATITLAIGTNPGSSTLGGTTSRQVTSGIATFDNLALNNAGTGYTLTASASGFQNVASAPFNVLALLPRSQEWVAREVGSWTCAATGGDSNVSSFNAGNDHPHSLTCTIPANTLKANSKIRACSLNNLQSDTAPPGLLMKLKANSTTLAANPTALTIGINQNQQAWVCYDTTVIGAPGGTAATTTSVRGTPSTLGNHVDDNSITQTVNLATNAPITLGFASQFVSGGSALTQLTQQAFAVRISIP